MKKDLKIISGDFIDNPLPKELSFLKKYFKNENAIVLIKYYLEFEEIDNFVNHTGIYETKKYLNECLVKFKILIENYKKANEEIDLELLELIKSGKFKIK